MSPAIQLNDLKGACMNHVWLHLKLLSRQIRLRRQLVGGGGVMQIRNTAISGTLIMLRQQTLSPCFLVKPDCIQEVEAPRAIVVQPCACSQKPLLASVVFVSRWSCGNTRSNVKMLRKILIVKLQFMGQGQVNIIISDPKPSLCP